MLAYFFKSELKLNKILLTWTHNVNLKFYFFWQLFRHFWSSEVYIWLTALAINNFNYIQVYFLYIIIYIIAIHGWTVVFILQNYFLYKNQKLVNNEKWTDCVCTCVSAHMARTRIIIYYNYIYGRLPPWFLDELFHEPLRQKTSVPLCRL